jgi:hypothetical protein
LQSLSSQGLLLHWLLLLFQRSLSLLVLSLQSYWLLQLLQLLLLLLE